MNNPINRTTIQTASNKYKLYPKVAPCCYKKSDGTYDHIDLTFNDTTSTIGNISLLEKNIVSVGIRKDNNPHKYVGIRPDNNQANGTQQLEFSLINVELDGESQSFNCDTDYEVKVNGSKVKQLVKVNKTFKDFKVEFDIHAKGLPLENSKYTEETIIRDYSFNITNLGEIEAGNTEYTSENIFTESKDIPYIDCCIFKITNDYITTGEYSIEEEFGDSDLSGYILNNLYPNGSSVYYKDCIVLSAKWHNLDNCLNFFLTNLCSIYGLEVFDDGGSGKYLTKDGKKVIGYTTKNEDEFLLFVNTTAIPDSIKSLFKRKTFNDTSYLDITLDSFKESLEDKFNLSLQLKVDSDYYQPIQDKFKFKISDEHFYIKLPTLFDESYNAIDLGTTHTLKDNGDGSYRYTKYFNTQGRLLNTGNIKYIDADLTVSEDESRPQYNASVQITSSRHTTLRNATTGTAVQADQFLSQDYYLRISAGMTGTVTAGGQFGNNYTYAYYQTHYLFDSSGITDTVTDLNWKHKSGYEWSTNNPGTYSYSDISVICIKSNSEGGNQTSNWNDFAGHTSSWSSSDVTEYSDEIVVDDAATFQPSSPGTQAWYTSAFNSDAKSDLENDDTFKFAVIDYDHYYSNTFQGYGSISSGLRYLHTHETDAATSLRPYLEVTTGEAEETVTYDANFFGANF